MAEQDSTADTETPEQAARRIIEGFVDDEYLATQLGLEDAITTAITNAVAGVDARAAWEASPNRDFSGRKCTECGFDNRFHDELCLFQSPNLRITSKAFNALHDDFTNAVDVQKERDATIAVVEILDLETQCMTRGRIAERVQTAIRQGNSK